LKNIIKPWQNNSTEGNLIRNVKTRSWCQNTFHFSITSARKCLHVHKLTQNMHTQNGNGILPTATAISDGKLKT